MQLPPKSDGFERQLEAYSATSKSITSASNWRDRLGSWPIYAAATASALAYSTSAAAETIYMLPNFVVSISPATGDHRYRALDGFSALNVNFVLTRTEGSYGLAYLRNANGAFEILDSASIVKKLAPGGRISGGAVGSFYGSGRLSRETNAHHDANWGPGHETGYAGFRLSTTGLANFDYGWLKLSLMANSKGFPTEITLIEYALNDVPGQSIYAGAPEPATKAMMLLACGFGGVLAWRKRKTAV